MASSDSHLGKHGKIRFLIFEEFNHDSLFFQVQNIVDLAFLSDAIYLSLTNFVVFSFGGKLFPYA